MDAQLKLELEAAAFRRLQQHLIQDRPDVQTLSGLAPAPGALSLPMPDPALRC